jgi:hypothetical protein
MGVAITDARPVAVTPIKVSVGAISINNTEAQVIGLTLPANYLKAGSAFRFTAGGTYQKSEPPVAAGQAIARLRIGAVSLTGGVVADWRQAIKSTAASSLSFAIQGMLKVTAAGASGSCTGWVAGRLFTPDPLFDVASIGTVSINTTGNLVMELTYVGASDALATFAASSIERVSEVLPPDLV